ncbi:hypothetical protein FIBSPDRAFT_902813 [Athelia psychrophila]|uniref:Uncharacterized protein n=1 Tax=Athelia psychrophila TaxID=1759441 RepID=A0A167WSI9_9AGAM|nr:hypothetical protein FIBSPDRAFT_902813 [Fibularhizoctonia sp. CBS 109695]
MRPSWTCSIATSSSPNTTSPRICEHEVKHITVPRMLDVEKMELGSGRAGGDSFALYGRAEWQRGVEIGQVARERVQAGMIPYTQQYRTAPLCTHFEILDRHTALPPRFLNALCILFVIQGWTIDTTSAILRVPAGSEPRDATNFIHAAFQPIHLRHRKWSCYGEHRASQLSALCGGADLLVWGLRRIEEPLQEGRARMGTGTWTGAWNIGRALMTHAACIRARTSSYAPTRLQLKVSENSRDAASLLSKVLEMGRREGGRRGKHGLPKEVVGAWRNEYMILRIQGCLYCGCNTAELLSCIITARLPPTGDAPPILLVPYHPAEPDMRDILWHPDCTTTPFRVPGSAVLATRGGAV